MARTLRPEDLRQPTTEQRAETLKTSLADLLKAAQAANQKNRSKENK